MEILCSNQRMSVIEMYGKFNEKYNSKYSGVEGLTSGKDSNFKEKNNSGVDFGEAAILELSGQHLQDQNKIEANVFLGSKAVAKGGKVNKIQNGAVLSPPKSGTTITVSLGVDVPSKKAKVAKTNAWSIEYSIDGCRRNFPNQPCTKRLNSALKNFSNNEGNKDLLKLKVPGFGECYAGAMVEGFGKIGDIAEITLDNGKKFNFMLLDTKNIKHHKADLAPNQCQNKWGHGYMLDGGKTVQLNICEFITSKSADGKYSAVDYASGTFLKGRSVLNAKIIGHADL